jgi:hypothetical protein
MIFPIFLPIESAPEPAPEPMGGKFSHMGVSAMLAQEQEMLDIMVEHGIGSELEIERQKGKIDGLQLAKNLTEQNTNW